MNTSINNIALTETARKLLDVVNEAGGEWLSRKEIVEKIDPDRKQLNVREDEALTFLAFNGLIDMEQRPIKSAIPFQVFYRAISQSGD